MRLGLLEENSLSYDWKIGAKKAAKGLGLGLLAVAAQALSTPEGVRSVLGSGPWAIAAAPLVVMVGVWFSNYLKHR